MWSFDEVLKSPRRKVLVWGQTSSPAKEKPYIILISIPRPVQTRRRVSINTWSFTNNISTTTFPGLLHILTTRLEPIDKTFAKIKEVLSLPPNTTEMF